MSDQAEQKRALPATNTHTPALRDEYSLTVGPGGPNLLQDRYPNERHIVLWPLRYAFNLVIARALVVSPS